VIQGSCLCGGVTYEADGEIYDAHNCHCSRCRKATGAAYRSSLFIPAETFRYTSGKELVRRYVPAADRSANFRRTPPSSARNAPKILLSVLRLSPQRDREGWSPRN